MGKPDGPRMEVIDVQARHREDCTFCVVAQAHDMTDEQFSRFLANLAGTKFIAVPLQLIEEQKGGN